MGGEAENMLKPDDKILVIFSASTIAVLAIFFMPDPAQVVTSVVTGLFGVAVGRTFNG